MSEVDLAGLENNVKQKDTKISTAMQEINIALKECGVGWFHVLVLSTSLVGLIAGVIVTNTTPYILPVAECDLNMNLLQKGLLNAMPYIGMILISIVAGFLTDTFGRKIFLVCGFGGLFLFAVIAGSSQTYEVLLTTKFFEGILFAITFSAAITITSEFCYKEIRDRVLLLRSSFLAVAQILIAAISWGILTQDWELSLFNGFIDLHVWNFYIYIMSIWSLISCILHIVLPESPRYYVTQRKFDEARKILIKIYTMNTGKPAETFKIKSGNETYINSIILGFVSIIPFAVSGILVNKVGKRNLYVSAAAICVGVTLGIRWANSKVAVVALFSLDAAISQTMVGLYQAFTMELFPTITRTLAISVIMTSGRIGTLAGNVAFPILLNMGCVVPFYTLTAVMICVTFMSMFLPKS